MDAEAALILGKSAIVISLIIAGVVNQLSDKDPEGLYFMAFLAFLFFIQ